MRSHHVDRKRPRTCKIYFATQPFAAMVDVAQTAKNYGSVGLAAMEVVDLVEMQRGGRLWQV
jgi:hypothetical protein